MYYNDLKYIDDLKYIKDMLRGIEKKRLIKSAFKKYFNLLKVVYLVNPFYINYWHKISYIALLYF